MKKFSFLVLFVVIACATSPTGRKQLLLMPDSQLNAMGSQAFDEMKRKSPREMNPQTVGYVECVAYAIIAHAKDDTGVQQWEVEVFRRNDPNAFALPGGKMGVHTGMLNVAKNQHQLAAVMGHEVGHVIARHGNERVSQSLAGAGGLAALSAMMSDGDGKAILMGALGLGFQFGVSLPHGRTQESEADKIGLMLMAKAGFDPRQSVDLWKNMASHGGGSPPEFMSTHPSHSTRISNLEKWMPEAMPEYHEAARQGRRPNCSR